MDNKQPTFNTYPHDWDGRKGGAYVTSYRERSGYKIPSCTVRGLTHGKQKHHNPARAFYRAHTNKGSMGDCPKR